MKEGTHFSIVMNARKACVYLMILVGVMSALGAAARGGASLVAYPETSPHGGTPGMEWPASPAIAGLLVGICGVLVGPGAELAEKV